MHKNSKCIDFAKSFDFTEPWPSKINTQNQNFNEKNMNNDNQIYYTALYLFVLGFYGPVNPMGSCPARSVYLTTRLLGRLSPLSG